LITPPSIHYSSVAYNRPSIHPSNDAMRYTPFYPTLSLTPSHGTATSSLTISTMFSYITTLRDVYQKSYTICLSIAIPGYYYPCSLFTYSSAQYHFQIKRYLPLLFFAPCPVKSTIIQPLPCSLIRLCYSLIPYLWLPTLINHILFALVP